MTPPLVNGLSHIALAVPQLEAALTRMEQLLGIAPTPIQENAGQHVRLAYFDLGNTRIEVLQPTDTGSPLGRFLERNPRGGIHHLSLSVADLDVALDHAAIAGAPQVGTVGRSVHGERLAFLDPRETLGALFELEEAGPTALPAAGSPA